MTFIDNNSFYQLCIVIIIKLCYPFITFKLFNIILLTFNLTLELFFTCYVVLISLTCIHYLHIEIRVFSNNKTV